MYRTSLTLSLLDTFARLRCTRENEEYQCGSACQTTCNNLGEKCSIANFVSA